MIPTHGPYFQVLRPTKEKAVAACAVNTTASAFAAGSHGQSAYGANTSGMPASGLNAASLDFCSCYDMVYVQLPNARTARRFVRNHHGGSEAVQAGRAR